MDIPQDSGDSNESVSSNGVGSAMSKTNPQVNEPQSETEFVVSVKDAFSGGYFEVYEEFLYLMDELRKKRMDVEAVRLRIRLLFRGHPQLLEGFDTFVPAEDEEDEDDEIPQPNDKIYPVLTAIGLVESMRFINKVKVAYLHDVSRYKLFLKITTTIKDREELYEAICILLHDRPDLIACSRWFLSDD